MAADYLMAGQQSELERLQLQSRVWEPAGQILLARLPSGSGLRVLDVGCGAMGWLRVLPPPPRTLGPRRGDHDRACWRAAGELPAPGATRRVARA